MSLLVTVTGRDHPGVTTALMDVLATYDAGGKQATNVHFFKGNLYVTVAAKEAVFKLPLGVKGWRYSTGCGY